jgi:oxygen-independent coproporphyrinogen-3 oxidase
MELEVLKEDARTNVGSYFVANYPPFSAWKREYVPAALERLRSRRPAGDPTPVGLYLHIPFCRKRCKFCYFRVFTDKNSRDVEQYMQALADEIAMYRDMPRLDGRQFEFVYFGGGTPSFLSSKQLERLIERINRHWRWDAAREVTFECEPGTLKKHKLETIKAIGVTRLSLGVEHFNDRILEENGRAHQSPEIYRAYGWARQVGFQRINIDLIAGMVGDCEESWRDTVEQALRLEPDSLTIYQMELPHNTEFSRRIKDGAQSPVADWATKRRWVKETFERFEAAGYVVSSGYTLVRPGAHSGFVYRDSLWRGADMVGTGVASFSHLAGVHFQNFDQWDDYLRAVAQGRLPINRALPVTEHQSLIREMILQMKLGRLDTAYFADKFGVDVLEQFGDAFGSLVNGGFAQRNGETLTLTRDGLLRVDGLLPRFFEPQFRGVRYT